MSLQWRLWAAACAGAVAVAAGWMVGPDLFSQRPDTAETTISQLLATDAKKPTDKALADAEALTRKELGWSPAQPALWARLAQIRTLRQGRLDGEATSLLERSYVLSPYDSELVLWRTAFTFDHWGSASPALRRRARDEAGAFYAQAKDRTSLNALGAQVHDPAGRFALSLVFDNAARAGSGSLQPALGLPADSTGGETEQEGP